MLAGAFYAVRWYDTNSYFVGVNNNELVIYQGRIGGFLWYNPVEVRAHRCDHRRRPRPATSTSSRAGVEETSVANARSYVHNLETTRRCQLSPTSPSCSTPPTSTTTVPPTTAVPPTTTKGA